MKRFLFLGTVLIIIAAGMSNLIGNAGSGTMQKSRNGTMQKSRNGTMQKSNIPADRNQNGIPKKIEQGLTARNAILIDEVTGKTIFEKNSRKRCFPASTTKILTALVAIENGIPDETITVGDAANLPAPGSSIAGIRYGEKLTLRQLLNCLLIPSGNDAAYVIASHIGKMTSKNARISDRKAVEVFCELMNKRAKELGAKDSSFINPDGFHDTDHYTTTYDMSLIARKAMEYEEFRNIVKKTMFRLPDIKAKI